jgi:hypothetical protein
MFCIKDVYVSHKKCTSFLKRVRRDTSNLLYRHKKRGAYHFIDRLPFSSFSYFILYTMTLFPVVLVSF